MPREREKKTINLSLLLCAYENQSEAREKKIVEYDRPHTKKSTENETEKKKEVDILKICVKIRHAREKNCICQHPHIRSRSQLVLVIFIGV